MKARRWLVLLATVLAAALTLRLGLWQLDRAAQKTALQTALDERRALPPLAPPELARQLGKATAQHHRRIRLTGQWADAHTVYLENRQMHGRPGFFVVTPLRLDDGSAVLVQRGWLPRDLLDRTRVQAPALPSGEVQVAGRIAPPPGRLYEFDGAASGVLRQNLDMTAFALETGLQLRPLSLVQEADASKGADGADGADGAGQPRADGLLRDWPNPATGVAKHHGYAFQWFALAALIVGLYVWFQLFRPWRHKRHGP